MGLITSAIGIAWAITWLIIAAFISIAILQNFWRPILISRCADMTKHSQTATILSIESQAKSLVSKLVPMFTKDSCFSNHISHKELFSVLPNEENHDQKLLLFL